MILRKLDIYIRKTIPLITFCNTLNGLYKLHDSGVESTLNGLFIPAFFSTYGCAIIAGVMNGTFQFTGDSLIYFISTLLLFIYMSKSPCIQRYLSIFPIIGKTLSYGGARTDTRPLPTVIGQMMLNEVVSKMFDKVYYNKEKIVYTNEDMANLLLNIAMFSTIRLFTIPDHLILMTLILIKLIPYIQKKMSNSKSQLKSKNKYV